MSSSSKSETFNKCELQFCEMIIPSMHLLPSPWSLLWNRGHRPAGRATAAATTPSKRRMCAHGPASGFPVVSSEPPRGGRKEERTTTRGGRGKGEFEHPLTRSLPRVPSSFHPRLLVCPACTPSCLVSPDPNDPKTNSVSTAIRRGVNLHPCIKRGKFKLPHSEL